MTYFTGFVLPVPAGNKQAYADHATASWPMFKRHGALRMVECWGEDVPRGAQTDFFRATQARDDEVPMFSWIEWPDRETAETAWATIIEDTNSFRMTDMPFDGARMFWGGFSPLVDES
ncbi:MAG: DUF1428 domain-containing protein [Paracoccus sp. (in: a-proteobacteria)]|uniref:DUF1428 domain-containing protein n=1 Tax=Paracoccus sp. TaxID=267 RepID=UPI00391BEF0B